MADIVISGDSSGSITLRAPAVSGTTILTMPTTSGTLVTTAGGSTVPFALGSAAAPSITFTGDTNTGMFSPGADTIAFSEGGVESMRINSSGFVGINTTNPQERFDVNGNIQVGYTASGQYVDVYNGDTTNYQRLRLSMSGNNAFITTRRSGGTVPQMLFGIDNTEVMRIDSSGNVGIGTDSPAFASGSGLEVQRAGDATVRVERTGATNSAGEFVAGSGLVKIGATSGSPFAFITDNTERMRIDSSGNWGLGTTTTSTYRATIANNGGNQLRLYATDVSTTTTNTIDFWYLDSGGTPYNNTSIRSLSTANAGNGNLVFYTRPTSGSLTERVRITPNGSLLVNTLADLDSRFNVSGNSDGTFNPMTVSQEAAGSTSRTSISFYRTAVGANVGGITTTNTSTAYNTSSDYRLKENITPMTGALATVQALKPVTYAWKIDGTISQGFIAHELQEVVPQAVSGEKDAVDAKGNPQYQGIDTSFLVATLTAAIQELNAKVTALEAQLGAK